jgi:hypothetical protein
MEGVVCISPSAIEIQHCLPSSVKWANEKSEPMFENILEMLCQFLPQGVVNISNLS